MCSNAGSLCVSLQAHNCKLNRRVKLWAHGSRPNLADGSPNLSMESLPQVCVNVCFCLYNSTETDTPQKYPLNNLGLHKDEDENVEVRCRRGLVLSPPLDKPFTHLFSLVIFFTLQWLFTSSVYWESCFVLLITRLLYSVKEMNIC